MQKVQIIVHKSKKDEVLEFLQDKGVFHVVDISKDEGLEDQETLDRAVHAVEFDISEIVFALEFLTPYHTPKRKGLEALVEGDNVVLKTEEEIASFIENFDSKGVVKKAEQINTELTEIHNQLASYEDQKNILAPWTKLDFSLSEAKETRFTRMLLGKIDKRDLDLFQQEITKISPYTFVKKISADETQYYVYVIHLIEEADQIQKVLEDFSFSEESLLQSQNNASEELKHISESETKFKDRIQELEKEAKELADKHIETLRVLFDTLSWQKENQVVRKNFQFTSTTALMEGWIHNSHYDELKKYLDDKITYCEISKVDTKEGEVPPVELANSNFVHPFESVTNLYGLPLYSEIDPTKYLAPFFIFFFAFCLTDAGYGILLMIMSLSLIKILKLSRKESGLLRLLFYAGFMTFVLGIFFGGWFGIDPKIMPEWLTYQTVVNGEERTYFYGQMLDPVKSALPLLGFAFILGYVQLIFGKILDGYSKIKRGEKKEALMDSFTWVFLLIVLALYIASMQLEVLAQFNTPLYYLLIAGIVTIVLTQGRYYGNIIAKFFGGVLGLWDLVGFVSDTLSYARLLALGLATGIIATSINLIAGILGDMIPVVGIVVSILILVVGHVFNLLLNTLGSFIHSGRLQFIEFFGKFMEGGGLPFDPLRKKSKYIKIR